MTAYAFSKGRDQRRPRWSGFAPDVRPPEGRRIAGAVCVGDWHALNHDLTFGGIGNSGVGSYHGEEGFCELSHARAVFTRWSWFPVQLFYPPHGTFVHRLVMRLFSFLAGAGARIMKGGSP